MTDLFAARSQMAMSLAFHIIFAVIGIAMPVLMIIAEGLWLRTGDPVYRTLAKRWTKGTAIMFAVGAVSGTVLSFELGLLWPTFMQHAGPIIGMPFSLEGFAFFLEAIFLGIYVYGWDRVGPKAHWCSGLMVAICGTLSGVFVVAANGWMNSPQGFDLLVEGVVVAVHSPSDIPAGLNLAELEVVAIRPFEAMFNPSFFTQALHMTVAAFCAVGFGVAGVHAFMLRRRGPSPFHSKALTISLLVGSVGALAMPITGDMSAKHVAEHQPAKFAAMEAHWETESGAALIVGGWPDEEAEETRFALHIPKMLSFMAHGDFDATVVGLSDIPEDERPPVLIPHLAFQIMVGCGFAMIGVSLLWGVLLLRRRRPHELPKFLLLVMLSSPLGFIAIEAGWFVTEVGRQPWIVHKLMRTSEAVTPMPNLTIPLLTFSLLYVFLSVIVFFMMRHQVFASPKEGTPNGESDAGV